MQALPAWRVCRTTRIRRRVQCRVGQTSEMLEGGEGLDQPAPPATVEQKELVLAVTKKRKLYKQLTGDEVPWFPHDNDMDLLKELC